MCWQDCECSEPEPETFLASKLWGAELWSHSAVFAYTQLMGVMEMDDAAREPGSDQIYVDVIWIK